MDNYCIYVIEALSGRHAGWKYVGQTKNFTNRWSQHLIKLRNQEHYNVKLQRYSNKYGLNALKFSVLLHCKKNELNYWEKFFIESFDSIKNGFNFAKGGYDIPNFHENNNCPNFEYVEYDLIGPKGESIKSKNLHKFAKKYNLCYAHLHKMVKGGCGSCKGWRLSSPINKFKNRKVYFKIIGPEGQIIEGDSLSKFAKQYHLPQSNLWKVVNGERPTCHGWKLYKEI